MKRCNNCGANVDSDWKFCGKCGSTDFSDLTNEMSDNKAQEIDEVLHTADTIAQNISTKTNKKKKVWLFVLIPAAAVLLIIVAIVLITALGNKSGTESNSLKSFNNDITSSETSSYTDKQNEASSEQTKSNTKTESQEDIPYDMVELYKAINIWCQYDNYGVPTDFTNREIVYGEAYEYLTPSQASWAKELKAAYNFMSFQSEKDKLNKYIDASLTKDFSEDRYLYYRGIVYCVIGQTGVKRNIIAETGWVTVNRVSYNTLNAKCSYMNELGDLAGEVEIQFVYKDGNYKIVDVTYI